jgi:serine/threonine protein kinase
MKERGKEFENKREIKKKIIFQVLNKKRQVEYNSKDFYQPPKKKKKLFILEKPIININRINTEIKNNENNINVDNNANKNISIKNVINFTTTPIIAESNIKNNKNLNNDLNNNKIDNVQKNNNNQNIFGEFICSNEDKIGSGSFGEVLYGMHKNSCLEVAVKILNSDISQDNIKREITFTKLLNGAQGFPTLYYAGVYDKKNIIVESLLGPSLDKLFKFCGRMFPLKTVCLIGIEMVKRLETMHDKGIIHRDLKPNNLTWGNYNSSYKNMLSYNINSINPYDKLDINTIYLIDFGLSCTFWDNIYTQKHYKYTTGLNFVGTLRYASLNSHNGIKQSRRDDLESMIYILIYFLKGKLPWQDIKAKNKEERYKIIQQKKSKISIDSLCQSLPNEFADLLKYVKELKFDARPIYYKFYNSFQNIINKLNCELIQEKNYNYIWEKILADCMNKYDDQNIKEIIIEAERNIFKGYPINLKSFINYIIYNNKMLNENNLKKKESPYIGDSTESMESNTFLK